jgi:hypothetical protein
MISGMHVEGLEALQSAVRQSLAEIPRATTVGLIEAGHVAQRSVASITAFKTGRLSRGWQVEVIGYTGAIFNRVPYAGVAVYSVGPRWGFDKYGPPARWGPRGIEQAAGQMEAVVTRYLSTAFTFHGWAHG